MATATWWFTADQHFNHYNIITHCNRPFKTLQEMDETLIANWNGVVHPRDTIVILGDFFWGNHQKTEDILKWAQARLNGNKIFIKGNHDNWIKRDKRYMYIKKVVGLKIFGCHYPLAAWPNGINLHGHCHGTFKPINPRQMDIGVDTHPDYRPYNIDEIKTKLEIV